MRRVETRETGPWDMEMQGVKGLTGVRRDKIPRSCVKPIIVGQHGRGHVARLAREIERDEGRRRNVLDRPKLVDGFFRVRRQRRGSYYPDVA